jgi:D-Tyr-tRNA(Tyr) deacylase
VAEARVVIDGNTVGQIGPGLLVLVCAERGDAEMQVDKLLAKILKLRIFSDDAGKMNRSVQDVGGGLLIVSPRSPPMCRAATGPASLALRRPTRGGDSMTILWCGRRRCIPSCKPGNSPPPCRYIWSTMAR